MEAFPERVKKFGEPKIRDDSDRKVIKTVTVEIDDVKYVTKGIGNNKKLAKRAAAKCILRQLKIRKLL
jgi:dsRNA-specific ribonuclease